MTPILVLSFPFQSPTIGVQPGAPNADTFSVPDIPGSIAVVVQVPDAILVDTNFGLTVSVPVTYNWCPAGRSERRCIVSPGIPGSIAVVVQVPLLSVRDTNFGLTVSVPVTYNWCPARRSERDVLCQSRFKCPVPIVVQVPDAIPEYPNLCRAVCEVDIPHLCGAVESSGIGHLQ